MAQNRFVSVLVSVVLLAGVAGCVHQAAPPPPAQSDLASPLMGGVAEVDITPPVGFRLAGYFYQRFSTGTHDLLKAKAIVLGQGNRKMAFVFCDLVGVDLSVTGPARARASAETGIPVANIVIAATHSHTGPLFDSVLNDYFHRQAIAKYGHDRAQEFNYPAFLTRQMTKVIVDAYKNLQPAEVDEGIGKQFGLAFNRRYHMKNGLVVCNPGVLNSNIVRPAGPIDPDLEMLIVKNKHTGQPEGGLTIFAMHADTTGGTEFSADYPYYIQQTLREKLGSNYVSAFAAGTSGDINQVDVTKRGLLRGAVVAGHLGGTIGENVLTNLTHLQAIAHPDFAVRSTTLILPLQTTTPRKVAEAKVIFEHMQDPKFDIRLKAGAVKDVDLKYLGLTRPAEVQVFRLDKDTAIVGLPAEIFVDLGLAIKHASPFKHTMVMEICNDRPGYMPTIKAFHEGSYEIINSRFAPGDGEKMVAAAIRMLNELKRQP